MRADQHREVVAPRQPNPTPAEVAAADELTVHDQTIGIYEETLNRPFVVETWSCTRCGKPMNPAHTAKWIGPGAPRHGNCANYAEESG